jgi:hypothetical protein
MRLMSNPVRASLILAFVAVFAWSCQSSERLAIQALSQYSTYDAPTPRLLSSQDPVFQWMQLQERIQRELQQQVPEMGLEYSSSRPELSFYTYTIDQRLAQTPVLPYQTTGYGLGGKRFTPLTDLSDGVLIMDVVDPVNKRLLWRGHVALPLGNSEQTHTNLPNAIRVLLSKASDALSASS